MKPYYEDESVTLYHGDCLDVLTSMDDESVDSIVTDPPYGLGFMGKAWDDLPPGLPWAQECLRVLKPGGHLLAFGGTRTWHRLAVAVEDAGFEVRDSIAWLYGSGFPKSLDVSKAIDKIDGLGPMRARALAFTAWMRSTGITASQINEATGTFMGSHYLTDGQQPAVPTVDLFEKLRPLLPAVPDEIVRIVLSRTEEVENLKRRPVTQEERAPLRSGDVIGFDQRSSSERERRDIAATPAAQQWAGWGTALKPAFEPVVVARKPLAGTVAGNVLAFGTGALNIDATRVGNEARPVMVRTTTTVAASSMAGTSTGATPSGETTTAGRWPANVVLDGTQADALDTQSGTRAAGNRPRVRNADKDRTAYGEFTGQADLPGERMDAGGASRFFPTFRYQAKAPTAERPKVDGVAHPTVKPLELMRWLVRLVTPPGGTVLEPFAGSGTTVEAAMLEGFRVTAIEREADYLPLILARINRVGVTPPPPEPEPSLLDLIEGDVA